MRDVLPVGACRLSVVISTRNRAALLDATLSHLSQQSLSRGTFEVVVADNGSEDATPEVLARWTGKMPLKTVHEPVPGKNRALNRAIPVTQGGLLVFTDDDIVPGANWLDELDQAAERWPDDSVFGGKIVPRFPEGTLPFLRDAQFPYARPAFGWFDLGPSERPVSEWPFGANVSIRRKVFDQWKYNETIGPADKNFAMGSESELLQRLALAGFRMIYVPRADVEHVIEPHQVTLKWLESRGYRYGRGYVRLRGSSNSRMLWNAPRHLWRKAIELWLASAGARFSTTKQGWCASIDYYKTRGMIDEFRTLHQKGSCREPGESLIDGSAVNR